MLHDFFAYFFIPVSSILFAGTSNWMTTNFSILRNGNQKEPLFLMWAFSVIICFSHWFGSLSQRLSYAGKAVLLVRISCVILGIAILTPYLPETFPFWSRIHFYCAFLSPFDAVTLLPEKESPGRTAVSYRILPDHFHFPNSAMDCRYGDQCPGNLFNCRIWCPSPQASQKDGGILNFLSTKKPHTILICGFFLRT